MRRILIVLASVLILLCAAEGQHRTRQSVSRQRQTTQKQIAETNRKLTANNALISQRLGQLNRLDARMRDNNNAIRGLYRSIDSINRVSRRLTDSIGAMERRLASIRANYATAVRTARRNRNAMDPSVFIFSAPSFSQAYRRYRYLQEYSQWRGRRTVEIAAAVAELDSNRARLAVLKEHRMGKAKELSGQLAELKGRRDSTSTIVKSLKKDSRSLKAFLQKKQKEARQLDAELDRIIAEEQRKAREEAERKARQGGDRQPQKPAEQSAPERQPSDDDMPVLTGSFKANQGKLPMPVAGPCTVVSRFGRHKHKDLQYVEVNNSGIDLEVKAGTTARAIFAGKVSAIFHQPGYDNIVMVRHGEYLTIYANIASISVKTGEQVKAGQIIGIISPVQGDRSHGILHFEIRHEKQKLDPLAWIRR